MPKVLVLLLFLALFSAGGCLDQKEVLAPPRLEKIAPFQAVYSSMNMSSKIQLTFGAPESIVDSDLVEISAYPLTVVRLPVQPNTLARTYWLSSDARVIRTDSYCAATCSFDYGDVNWLMRGHWPPFGAFAQQALQASTTMVLGGSPLDVRTRMSSQGEIQKLAVDTSEADGLFVSGYPDLTIWDTYIFEVDPVPIEMTRPGARLVLESFSSQPQITANLVLPLRDLPVPESISSPGTWFPNSNVPVGGNNVSVDDAMLAAMNNSEEFSTAISNPNCVSSIALQRTFVSGENLGLEVTQVHASKFQAVTSTTKGAVRWYWQRTDDAIRGPSWSTLTQEVAQDSFACLDAKPPFSIGAKNHQDQAVLLFAESGKIPVTLQILFQSRAIEGCSCPNQATRFQTGLGTEGSGGMELLSVVDQSAVTGYIMALGGTGRELDALPGRFGR